MSQFSLLKTKRFVPLFLTQFFGAFNDNLFKNALMALIVFGVAREQTGDGNGAAITVSLAAALLIIPFILFSPLAGQLADKYAKDKIIRILKLCEIGIVALAFGGLLSGNIYILSGVLFLLGTQSAFFSPCKYAMLPQHLKEEELIGGNALLGVGTYAAILFGTAAGTMLVNKPGGAWVVGGILLICAVIGVLMSRKIPEAKALAPKLKIDFNPITEIKALTSDVLAQKRSIFYALVGIAWFYFTGATFLTQLPTFVHEVLYADESVLTFFMVLFTVSIALGGLINNRLLGGRVEVTWVPLAALGVALFTLDLYFAGGHYGVWVPEDINADKSIGEFISYGASWRIIADITLIGICGGLYVVPLNAVLQKDSEEKHRARVMAASAFIDAIFIVSASLVAVLMYALGFSVATILLFAGLGNIAVGLFICRLIPQYLFKSLAQLFLKLLFRVDIKGMENFDKAGPRALIIANHVSFIDAAVLAAFLPGTPMFAVDTHIAQRWWIKPFLKLIDAFPLDPTNPFSAKSLINEMKGDRHCVIFPEGRLTMTGALMKVYEGPGMIADKADAPLVPIRLDGVQHTYFSRLRGKVPLRLFPKITMTVLEPVRFDLPDDVKGRTRRHMSGRQLYDLMENMMYSTQDTDRALFDALLDARYINGGSATAVKDVEWKPKSLNALVRASLVLGKALKKHTGRGDNVGVMLPNSFGALAVFFGLQSYGRIPAMMNFSAGAGPMGKACKAAGITTILTSKLFVEKARLDDTVAELSKTVTVTYLEDLRKEIGIGLKLFGLFAPMFARYIHGRQKIDAGDPAVVIFTSGSEGAPKGVVLSHNNLMSNIAQLRARVDFNREDIVFNCLPMFHSFGLTGGTLLPVLSGVETVLYPSPLHYRIVPEMVYEANATIMFGTDTFLNGYARMAHPYDFYRMRYIFAGAEKVRAETRQIYMERFGVRVLEGYGATEMSPVIAVNSPMYDKPGSVGRILAGIDTKIEPVEGIEEGGRLILRGDNVMLGYLKVDKPGVLQPPEDGWYDTGDIIMLDEEGYVFIQGRAKRFAKIAGEMISLGAVEQLAAQVWPNGHHAAIAIPDQRKGEQIVLVTDQYHASRDQIMSTAFKIHVSELTIPKNVLHIEEIPVLGSGKTDYVSLYEYVLENQ